jgi:hypothetical protein
MGRITDQLVSLVARQVRDKGIVVWYDPESAYAEVARALALPDVAVVRFEESFFELRARIEPFLEFVGEDGRLRADAATPPKVIVYVPRERRETRYALVEAESAGVVIEPGANPWQRNTRLSVIAERVFKAIAPDRADEIGRQVERGSLTLADLDRLAEQSAEIGAGAVKLIFGTASVADVALTFAASDEHDAQVGAKQALRDLATLFRAGLGVEIDPDAGIGAARKTLRRALLLADFAAGLPPGDRPNALASATIPDRPAHLETVQQICKAWRNRTDQRERYADAAKAVEAEAGVAGFDLDPRSLVDLETFGSIEGRLLLHAEERLLADDPDDALRLAVARKRSFWSVREPTDQLRWSLVETAARLLMAGARVRVELHRLQKSPAAMVRAYAEGPEPWCLLDTYHRHLERQYTTFDLEIGGEHDRLEQVIARARRRYMEVVGRCAEGFTDALVAADFQVEGVLPQEKVFSTFVAPRRKGPGIVAYVWVDALRFEMGRELVEGLGDGFESGLDPAIAQLPSITEVGMSALLPGAETGMDLVEAGAGKVAIKIKATVLKDRPARVKYLREVVGGTMAELKLNDLIKPSTKLRGEIERADFVLVTSQEIDRHGEEGEEEDETRRYMDEVLDKLRKGIRRLASLGVTDVVIAADHGYLFGEAIESGMKIDPPGGKTVDLHRRVWVGKGGSVAEGYVRVPASRVGLGGDLELAIPRGLACFKAGGSSSYFHGGASLQEVVIPMATVRVKGAAPAAGPGAIRLAMEKPKVTTRFFSVTATYAVTDLFGGEEKRVNVVARASHPKGGRDIGAAVMAEYGFEEGTGEILLRKDEPNAITLMLTGDTELQAASVHVLDAATGVELARLEDVAVAISL